MGIFLDSANLDDARRAQALGFIDGVTTNPTLIAATGRLGLDVLADLVEIIEGHVFYQVTALSVEGRYDQAWEAHDIRPDKVIVKIPATTENLAMATRLAQSGVDCLMTAVATPAQAYLAAQAQVNYVAPYVNRMTRRMGDGVAVVRDMARILQGTQTEILAASLKSIDEVVQVLLAGAHNVTVPLALIEAMGEDEFTHEAIREFNAALQQT